MRPPLARAWTSFGSDGSGTQPEAPSHAQAQAGRRRRVVSICQMSAGGRARPARGSNSESPTAEVIELSEAAPAATEWPSPSLSLPLSGNGVGGPPPPGKILGHAISATYQ